MYERKTPLSLDCGINLFREVLSGKWKIGLIHYISIGIKRPGELQRKLPQATRRVLDVQLNELRDHGLVSKTVFDELPPRTEYVLTPLGETLLPVMRAMGEWGKAHRDELHHVLGYSEDVTS